MNSVPVSDEFTVFDDPRLQKDFLVEPGLASSSTDKTSQQTAIIQIDNIVCAGCCSVIEKNINSIAGVCHSEINYVTHQMQVEWDSEKVAFSSILRRLSHLGYPAHPVNTELHTGSLLRQRRALIRQVGVAAALGMQVMVLSVCLYAGNWWGMDPALNDFFELLSLILTLPILAYSAQPFLAGALENLKKKRVGMDVPITLGLLVAWLASLQAVFIKAGDTYFDSIAMFVLLILGARLIELNYRLRALSALNQYDSVLPASCSRFIDSDNTVKIPTLAICEGDCLLIETGEIVPADGIVSSGCSSFDESLLTGERMPVVRSCGDTVVAGSINIEDPIRMQVTQAGNGTTLSAITRLVRRAQYAKPQLNGMIEHLASWFVGCVLTIAAMVALIGYFSGSDHWLTSTIAVLIVSCPCALALATPAALSIAMGRSLKLGTMVGNAAALETLDKVSHFYFDKTGTLTTGVFDVCGINLCGKLTQPAALQIVSSLEQHSNHPVAEALKVLSKDAQLPVHDVRRQAGSGLSGEIDGKRYFIGSLAYLAEQTGHHYESLDADASTLSGLADSDGLLCLFTLKDQLRTDTAELIKHLISLNKEITILSGDREAAVAAVAHELGISNYFAECSPEEKLRIVRHAADQGATTAMFGDGINDAPVIGAAHVSIAIGDRVNLTAMNADIVALNPSMKAIGALLSLSSRLRQTIRQNLTWALGYNLTAIPFAALGFVPPWLAAVGMSLSSLLVVLNSARLGRGSIDD